MVPACLFPESLKNDVMKVICDLGLEEAVDIITMGVAYPFDPRVESWVSGSKWVMVAEEGEPLLEDEVIKVFEGMVHGKQSGTFSHEGEFNLNELYDAFQELFGVRSIDPVTREDISVEFTWFCRKSCPAIGIVRALGELKALRAPEDIYVFGDMGCITRDLV